MFRRRIFPAVSWTLAAAAFVAISLLMGRPGRIEITTSAAVSGDRLVATVRDTGNGIPPDALTRIFEPFYTTKDVGKGTGLGLAIAYGIVQEHGGDIIAANHPGGGAVLNPLVATQAQLAFVTVTVRAAPVQGQPGAVLSSSASIRRLE